MPSPDVTANYIRIRVKDPKGFTKLRIKGLTGRVKAVVGFIKGGGSEIQSVLFPKDTYSVTDAKRWMNVHGHTIQEVYMVQDIMINPKNFEFAFIEEVYHGEEEKSKHDWLFDKRTNEDIFFGD